MTRPAPNSEVTARERSIAREVMMFFPFYSTMMLGLESSHVIGLRMLKLTRGGSDALNEMHLMLGEKLDAAIESGANLMAGASADSVVDRYRQHVAANADRLAIRQAAPRVTIR
jgi:hypothetical protein